MLCFCYSLRLRRLRHTYVEGLSCPLALSNSVVEDSFVLNDLVTRLSSDNVTADSLLSLTEINDRDDSFNLSSQSSSDVALLVLLSHLKVLLLT